MAFGFVKKTWKDRISEYPTRRTLTKEDGSTELVTVSRSEGTVSQEGDAFSADNMNDLETRVDNALTEANSNLTQTLTYNENTDYFGTTYNGEWRDVFFAGFQLYYIYANGNEFADKTGGWSTDGYSVYSGTPISGTVSKLENGISLSVDEVTANVRKAVIIGTKNIVDLSNHNKLCVSYNWGGEDFVTEVDISSVSSGYVSVSLDNYNYGGGQYHYSTVCISVNNAKEYIWNAPLADTLNRKDYASNLLSVSVKKVWLE